MTATSRIHEDDAPVGSPDSAGRPPFIDDDDSRQALRELLDEAGVRPGDLRHGVP